MNYFDVYYRALIDYRKNTVPSRECESQRGAVSKANAKADNVTVTRRVCTVNTDWIETIEAGLLHVDKAIREERQFIRSNGEVVDIEKVKGVSTESVRHLAQHSNLITRHEEGQDVVPDQLYIVERLNDYAVYENRFLYMLLCYLRDFISVRYNKILDLEHTYNGQLTMSKQVDMPGRRLSVDLKLEEERKNDENLAATSSSKDVIARIRDILSAVHAFLSTPLMEEVGKVAMLKPPITKTNVLRMNHNFRGAMALYEYVTAYEGDGFTVREEKHRIQPFRIDMSDEFSEIVLLASFLTYEYGMNIKNALQVAYEQEEERRRKEKEARRAEQIKALRRRIQDSGETPEEYLLMLEKRNRVLEAESLELTETRKEVEKLQEHIARLKSEKNELGLTIDRMVEEEEALKAAHAEELTQLREEQAERLQEQQAQFDEARVELEKQMKEAEEAHERAAEALRADLQAEKEQMQETCREAEERVRATVAENENLRKARQLSDARLRALRREQGLHHEDDFTSKETFEELERQLALFQSLFKQEWKKTKKSIRRDTFKAYREAIKSGREYEFLMPKEQAEQKNASAAFADENGTGEGSEGADR